MVLAKICLGSFPLIASTGTAEPKLPAQNPDLNEPPVASETAP